MPGRREAKPSKRRVNARPTRSGSVLQDNRVKSRVTLTPMNIRLAQPADALAIARIHVSSWQSAYRGLLAQEYLDGLHPEDRAPHYNFSHSDPLQPRTLVATENDAICGFVTTMPAREADMEGAAELAALYIDPHHCGNGIGTALINASYDNLVSTGYKEAYLWLLAGNTRAERFYTCRGWQTDGTQKTAALWGVTVHEIRYRRTLIPS
jgi:GNAT superfamily N-acetyltransferase